MIQIRLFQGKECP